ncbi:hypothetical protein ACIQMY_27230 [Streptomyces sp. NPDC091368]|uniref:hypothetical protein n=1 Tax=Streptomyces sp. NPDC091368 TaxID=3365993 RepID=UPI00382BB778
MFRRKKRDDDARDDMVDTRAEGAEAGADVTAEAPEAPATAVEDGADGTEDVGTVEVTAGGSVAAAEVVEIPKQQSAEAAADNEAGDGARR